MKILIFALIVFGLTMQCEKNDSLPPEEIHFSSSEISSLQKASEALYFNSWEEQSDKNFVISPLSIQLALYMAWNGADQNTKTEIGSLLLSSMDDDTTHALTKNLHKYFDHLLPDGELGVYNSLFFDSDRVDLQDEYRQIIQTYFDGEVVDLDFSSEEAVSRINEWVSEKTEDKIDEIIDQISTDELLFLINALYLKADWDHPFPVESTSDRPFYLENGQEVEIPTMAKTGAVEMGNDPDLKMIRMPLADTSLYMYFFRPSNEESINDLAVNHVFERLWNGELKFSSQRIMLSLPTFETRTHLVLNSPLERLGMKSAFDPQNADFSNMGTASTGRPLFLSRSLHDTYLRVDEKGVEGAAVTTLGIGTTSAPPVVRFDRPFMFLIADQKLNLPLFIGQFTGIESENH